MRRLALATLLLTVAAAAAQQSSREQDLAAIRARIVQLEQRLSGLDARRADVAAELDRTRVELELSTQRVAEAAAARDLVSVAIADNEQRVVELEGRLAALRSDLRLSLGWLYRLGAQGYLHLVLSVAAERELLPAIRTLRYLARHNAEVFSQVLDATTRLDLERRELAGRRAERERWLAEERGRREEIGRLERQQAGLLARLERERAALAAQAGSLTDQAEKLASFIDLLVGRSPTAFAGTPIQQFRGVLDWPVEGRVVVPFGPRLDPRYGTRVPHNGIDIATRAGSEVRAVYPGKVLFAAPFQGFGLAVVVHHPGRVFSLYARLEQVQVAEQDVVSLGDVIGRAADSCYLEIREENQPQDPLSWLR